MTILLRTVLAVFFMFAASNVASAQAVSSSTSMPVADLVVVYKSERKLQLFRNDVFLKSYDVDLGFSPEGDKFHVGDGRTPEGTYIINRRNENSAYHLSLGISYPNVDEVAAARARGESAGGDVFIHGGPTLRGDRNRPDWTAGCISVSNREMEEIWAMVPLGTLIVIVP